MHSCAPQVRPFQASSLLLSIFFSLNIWVGFRVANSCCDFSLFGGSIFDAEGGGNVNVRCSYEQYQM